MKKLLTLILFLVILLALPVGVGAGTAHYCDLDAGSNGIGTFASPWNNIGSVNSASFSSGDDVYFKCGTTSSGSEQLIVDWSGVDGNDPVVIGAYEGENDFVLEGEETKPIITGNARTYPSGSYTGLIVLSNRDFITVQDIQLLESYAGGVYLATSSGYSDGIVIQRCYIKDCRGWGVFTSKIKNSSILYNVLDRPRYDNYPGAGIVVSAAFDSGSVDNVLVKGNELFESYEGIGIYQEASGVTVENNIVYDCRSHMLYNGTGSYNNRWRYNIVYESTSDLDSSPDYAMVCANETGLCSSISQSYHNVYFYGNMIASVQYGLSLGNQCPTFTPNKIRVFGNTLVDNVGNYRFWSGWNGTNSIIKNNISATYESGTHANNTSPTGITWSYNLFDDAVGGNAGNGTGTLNNTEAGIFKTSGWESLVAGESTSADFALTADSLAINAGHYMTTVSSKSGNTLTLADAGWFCAGDTIYDDDGYNTTISSIDYSTEEVVVADAANFTTTDNITALPWYGAASDIGADQHGEAPQDPPPSISSFTVTPTSVSNEGQITWAVTATDTDAMTYVIKVNGSSIASELLTSGIEETDSYTLPSTYDDSIISVSCLVCDSDECAPEQYRSVTVGTQASATYTFGENTTDGYTSVFTDTSIKYWEPNQHSWANYTTILIKTNAWESYFQVDFTALTGKTISDTEIFFYLNNAPGTSSVFTLYDVSDIFDVDNATWNCAKDDNEDGGCDTAWTGTRGRNTALATVNVGSADSPGTQCSFDGATLDSYIDTVKGSTGYFCIVSDTASLAYLYSSDGTDGYRPKASITIGESGPAGVNDLSDAKAHWAFEDGALTTDSIGSYTLTSNGSPTADTSDYKQGSGSVDLNKATPDYYNRTGTAGDFNWDSSLAASVCMWIKPETSTAKADLFKKSASNKSDTYFQFNSDNTIQLIIGHNNGDSIETETSTGTVADGEWWGCCYCINFTGSTVNGIADNAGLLWAWDDTNNQLEFSESISYTNEKTWGEDAPFSIGTSPTGSNPFDGRVDGTVVWDGIKTADDFRAWATDQYPRETIGSWSMVSPGIGSYVKPGDTIIALSSAAVPIAFTDGGNNPTVIVTDGSNETTMTLVGGSATAYDHQWSGTVAANSDGALSIKAGLITLNNGTLMYGSPSVNIDTVLTLTGLGIYSDAVQDTMTATLWCNCATGAQKDDYAIVTADQEMCVLWDFSGAEWFVDGSLADLSQLTDADYGFTSGFKYRVVQPSGFGVGYDKWVLTYTTIAGDRKSGNLGLGATISRTVTKIMDAGSNEVANYNTGALGNTATVNVPKDANSPFEVKPSGGDATTHANLETALGASGLFATDYVIIRGITEDIVAPTAGTWYRVESQTGTFDWNNLAGTLYGENRVSGGMLNSGNATLHSYNPPRVSN